MNEENVNKAHQYVQNIFNELAPPENVYHNLSHTTEVVSAVKEIAAAEGVSADDLELLVIAAWFHDSGYVKTCKGHEEVSVGYVKEFLHWQRFYPGCNSCNYIFINFLCCPICSFTLLQLFDHRTRQYHRWSQL